MFDNEWTIDYMNFYSNVGLNTKWWMIFYSLYYNNKKSRLLKFMEKRFWALSIVTYILLNSMILADTVLMSLINNCTSIEDICWLWNLTEKCSSNIKLFVNGAPWYCSLIFFISTFPINNRTRTTQTSKWNRKICNPNRKHVRSVFRGTGRQWMKWAYTTCECWTYDA